MLPRNVDKCLSKNCAVTPVQLKPVPVPRYTMKQLRELFWQSDSNRDGRLSRKELNAAFKHLGAIIPGWRAHRALNRADDNDDGYISEEEIDDLVKYVYKLGYDVLK